MSRLKREMRLIPSYPGRSQPVTLLVKMGVKMTFRVIRSVAAWSVLQLCSSR